MRTERLKCKVKQYDTVKGSTLQLISTQQRLCACSRMLYLSEPATDPSNDKSALVNEWPAVSNDKVTVSLP